MKLKIIGTLTFTEFFITWLSTAAEDAVFEEWPQELWTVIARLVHESLVFSVETNFWKMILIELCSDKTLPVLLKQVKAAVIEYIKVASPSDEESQEQTNIWDSKQLPFTLC